jgi:hypothetical protein
MMIGKADIERFDEMSNRDKYYQLYDVYKLIEYLSTKHEINETRLNTTLDIIRSLGTIYGKKAEQDALMEGEPG